MQLGNWNGPGNSWIHCNHGNLPGVKAQGRGRVRNKYDGGQNDELLIQHVINPHFFIHVNYCQV